MKVFKVERGETMNQNRDYTALVKRRSELLLLSGSSWKEEYADELRQIDEQISEMRKEMKLDDKVCINSERRFGNMRNISEQGIPNN